MRKIQVNDIEYDYNVGDKYTKIKTIGVFKNELIGEALVKPVTSCDGTCGCDCGFTPTEDQPVKIRVTPAIIKDVIQKYNEKDSRILAIVNQS